MENIWIFFLFAGIVIVVSVLAAAIGYFWASSTTKSALLKQMKEQGDAAFKQAQEQLQSWKEQETNSIRQQTYDAAKGQVIQEMQEQVQKWQENELIRIRQQMLEGVRGEAIKEAQKQLAKWREDELESAKLQIREVLSKEAALHLEQWKVEAETEMRQDAINRSQSVTMGKMTEQLVPYLPGFCFNPTDARFIGSPIDLIVFDGLNNGTIEKVVFVEIKTGVSTLSTRERIVRDAIISGKVEWMELNANLGNPDVVREVKFRKRSSAQA